MADPEIKIKIKSEADLAAIKSTEDATKRATAAAAAYRDELLKAEATAAKAYAANKRAAAEAQRAELLKAEATAARALADQKRALVDSNKEHARLIAAEKKSMSELAQEIPGVGRALELLKNPVALAVAAFTALAAGLKKSVAEFSQAETQMGRLDAALARSGNLTEEYRAHLVELAGAMQKVTGVADDDWIEALRKLTQFGADASNIDALAKGVENLAGVMDGDLAGAATLIGRALQQNMDGFGRYGVEITRTGDKAKDLTALLKKLAELGEGQLASANKTLAGQFKTLANATSDFFEGIGGLISRTQIIQTVVYGFATSLDWLATRITPTIPVLDGLKNKVGAAGESLESAKDGAKGFAEAVGQIKTEAEGIARAFESALKAKRELFSEHDARDAAQEEYQTALVDKDVAAGKLTEPDARIRRAGIKQFYAGRMHGRKQDLLNSELNSVTAQDSEAEIAINQISEQIGKAQATTANATALEPKRQRLAELKRQMLQSMAEEEVNALGWVFGRGDVPDDVATAKVEGRRKRYFSAATELSNITGGMPRNTPFPATARAREEAVTAQGIQDVAGLTARRMGLNAQSETLRAQIDTGAIRYDLGQRTAVTQLQTASLQDVNKQRTTLAGQVQSDAHRGGGGNAEINEAVANLRSIGDSIEKIPQRLLRAIADTAAQARRASAHSEENLRLINTNRDH